MGVGLYIASLSIRRDRKPDWRAAARAIECLDLATIWDTGDDLFDWESWLEDVPSPPSALGVYSGIRGAQADLCAAARLVRSAIAERRPDQLLAIDLPEHRMYVTGGRTAGGDPSELFEPFQEFAQGGVAQAAGFEGGIQYAGTPIEHRRLAFTHQQMRIVHATRAFTHAEDAAIHRTANYQTAAPEGWVARIRMTLDRAAASADNQDAAGRLLLTFFAEILALILALEESTANNGGPGREQLIRETVERLEDVCSPRCSSVRCLTDLMSQAFTSVEQLLPTLAGRGDTQRAIKVAQKHGCQLPRAIARELSVHVLAEGLVGVADVFGDQVTTLCADQADGPPGQVRDRRGWPFWRAVPVAGRRRGTPSASDFDYADYFVWWAARHWNWPAAETAISTKGRHVEQLSADLRALRQIVEGGWSRDVALEEVGELRIWMTTEHDDWTLVAPLRRLGDSGVLRAAGAVGWG